MPTTNPYGDVTTTPAGTTPGLLFFNLEVIDSKVEVQRSVKLGSGGVPGSYENATGEVVITHLEVSSSYPTEVAYTIYDEDGEKDQFGDPRTVITGKSSVTTVEGKNLINLNETIQGVADPTNGQLKVTVQLTDSDDDISPVIYTTVTVSPRTPVATTPHAVPPIDIGSASSRTTMTPEVPLSRNRQPGQRRVGRAAYGDEDSVSASTTTPVLDLDISVVRSALNTTTTTTPTPTTQAIDTDIIDVATTTPDVATSTTPTPGVVTSTTPSGRAPGRPRPGGLSDGIFYPVYNADQLKEALNTYTKIVIVTDITLTETVNVPTNTVIRGINNPTVTFNGSIGFNIKEDNVILRDFSITNNSQNDSTNGVGIQITKPTRNSLTSPKNITIDSITFDRVGGFRDKFASILVTGYNFIRSQADSDSPKVGLLDGSEPIQNITITNNVITNSPNNGLDLWEIDGLTVSGNTVQGTRGQTEDRGNGIKGTDLRNAVIKDNIFRDIGRSGIEITGADTKNVLIQNNIIDGFSNQQNFIRTFTSGISISQGGSNGTIRQNIIVGSGRGAGVEVAQNSSNIRITSNKIRSINKGVVVTAHTDKVSIQSNTIDGANVRGIEIFQSWNIKVNDNTVIQPSAESLAGKPVEPGIVVHQSNGVQVVNNVIRGDYFTENNETGILVQGNYPGMGQHTFILYPSEQRLQRQTILYSQGLPNIFDELYNPASSLATSVVRNTFAGNILDGSGRLFFSNESEIVFPLTNPGGLESEGASKVALGTFGFPKVDNRVVIIDRYPPNGGTLEDQIKEGQTWYDEQSLQDITLVKVDLGKHPLMRAGTHLGLNTGTYTVEKLGQDPTIITAPACSPGQEPNPVTGECEEPYTYIPTDKKTYTLAVKNTAESTINVNGRLIGGGGEFIIGPQDKNEFRLNINFMSNTLPEGALLPLEIVTDNVAHNARRGGVTSELRGNVWRSTIDCYIIEPSQDGNYHGGIAFNDDDVDDDVTAPTTSTTPSFVVITDIGGGDGYDDTTTTTTTRRLGRRGCMDVTAKNFDPLATVQGPGDCRYDYVTATSTSTTPYLIPGCMDIDAENYNSRATVDDGTCYYPETSTTPGHGNPVYSLVVFNETDGDITVAEVDPFGNNMAGWRPVLRPGENAVFTSMLNNFVFSVNTGRVNIDTIEPVSSPNVDATFIRTQPNGIAATAVINSGTRGSVFITSYDPGSITTTTTTTTTTRRPGRRGCMDVTAQNFDPFATVQGPGDCIYDYPTVTTSTTTTTTPRPPGFPGCMDPAAQNYNEIATWDDGTCDYGGTTTTSTTPICIICPPPIWGCTNPRAWNHNPAATIDDGSCRFRPVVGCMDRRAENFNGRAVIHRQQDCRYKPDPPWPPEGGTTTPRLYVDVSTTPSAGVSTTPPPRRLGCMDDGNQPWSRFPGVRATNFDPFATVDDGSCIFPPILGCTDPTAINFDPAAQVDDNSCRWGPIRGCMDPTAGNFNPAATEDDGSCSWVEIRGCMDPNANNFNADATIHDDSCTYDIPGCMDPDANNYNPRATKNDGSCEYPPEKPWEPASCGRPQIPRSGTGDDFDDSESDAGSGGGAGSGGR